MAFFPHDQFGRSLSRNARWKRLIWTNEVSLIASFSLSDYIARSMGCLDLDHDTASPDLVWGNKGQDPGLASGPGPTSGVLDAGSAGFFPIAWYAAVPGSRGPITAHWLWVYLPALPDRFKMGTKSPGWFISHTFCGVDSEILQQAISHPQLPTDSHLYVCLEGQSVMLVSESSAASFCSIC